MLSLALYQPDMPQNTGSMMRLCACLGVSLEIIEPCGFVFNDHKLKRVAMDYIDHLRWHRHRDWEAFRAATPSRRIVLLTTKSAAPYADFSFRADDILLMGRESAGVPDEVHHAADARLTIPMTPDCRSMNVSLSAALVLGEALRQTGGFAKLI